jgi:hypothetical protein
MTDEERKADPRWKRMEELAATISRRQAEGARSFELAGLYSEKHLIARDFHGLPPE